MVVIGGGLVGASSAFRLQRAGCRVTLIDPGDERARASFGNATLICPQLVEPLASWPTVMAAPGKLFAFGGPLDFIWKDVAFWAPFVAHYVRACGDVRYQAGLKAMNSLMAEVLPAWQRLGADIGRPELVLDRPQWAVWEGADQMARERPVSMAGENGPAVARELASQEVGAIQRDISQRFVGGIAYEGTGKLTDPNEMVRALHTALTAGGAEIVTGKASGLTDTSDGVRVTLANGREIAAGHALISAGARSRNLCKQVGLTAPLVAERGYHLQYADHDLGDRFPPLMCDERWICITQAGRDVRITGFTEIGHPDSAPDPRKWKTLRHHVAELGLKVRGEPSEWMGCRPTLPDFLPAIGRKGRVLYAFGHQHVGLTMAAVTAEAVAELFGAEATPERLRAFDLARFA
ncbi:MAG: NAD(P)/FAD-dependent oxidoreductase [Caulobacteraceae bacterium]